MSAAQTMTSVLVVLLFLCCPSQVSGCKIPKRVQCDSKLASGCIGGDCDRGTSTDPVIEYTATMNGSQQRVVVANIASNLCSFHGAAGVVTINGKLKQTVDLNNVGKGLTYRLNGGDTIRVKGVQYVADQNMACFTAGSLDFAICDKV